MPTLDATPTTIQQAKAQGAKAGDFLSAPLAPAGGPIPVDEAPIARKGDEPGREPMVVVAVKAFWQSPTIKGLRNAVVTACGVAALVVAVQIISVNGDISKIDLQTTEKAAIGALAFSLASAYAAWWKRRDNNPTT